MNPIVLIAVMIALLGGAVFYFAWRQAQPKHLFLARDFNLGTIQPKKLKTLQGTLKVKRSDGKEVKFPIAPGFSQPRMDGKGIIIEGDLNTGQLIKPRGADGDMEGSNGIFLAAALADGRVDTLVRSTKGGGITLQHILIAVGVVGVLVVIVIYQFAKGSGGVI